MNRKVLKSLRFVLFVNFFSSLSVAHSGLITPVWCTLSLNLRAVVELQTDRIMYLPFAPKSDIPDLNSFVMLDRDVWFGSKVSQIGPKWDKSWAFKDQFQYILDR